MRVLLAALAITALPPRPAPGQWQIGFELGVARYGGSARDTSDGTGPPTLRPGDAATLGVRIATTVGQVGVALRGSYGKPGLLATGSGLTVIDRSSGELIELASLVAVQVARVGPSGAIRAELGPALHLWKFGDDIRSRVGALGATAYEWPVADRFSGAIRVEGMISRSWFDPADLPPEYARRATWRYGVTLGLRYRL